MTLSVIFPTYNERQNVEPLIRRVEGALVEIPHEVIFIDDSTDGTDAVIAALARRHPHIVLIHRDARAGLASAAVDGIRCATGDVVCVLDADLQHPPEILPHLLAALEQTGADVVVASRSIAGGGYESFSTARRFASRVATLLAHVLLWRARLVSDPMSGFFAVRRRVVQDVPLRPLGYKILLEILVRGRFERVVEVPYRFQSRGAGQSKLTWRQQREYLLHLLRLLTVQPDDLRFLRFCLVGGSGVLVNTGIFWALTSSGVHYLLAGMASIVTATTWNFFLNDAFTWKDRHSPSLRVTAARYLQYWMVTGMASTAHMAILALLTMTGLEHMFSNVIGITAASMWNFFTNSRWTWKPERPAIARAIYHNVPLEAPEVPAPVVAGEGRH